MRFAVTVAMLVGLGIAAGCNSPNEPDDPFVGAWSGQLTDANGGAGTMQLFIEARTIDYAGGWSATVGSASITGTSVMGAPSGAGLTLLLRCGAGGVTLKLTVSGNSASGSYSPTLPCPPLTTGSVSLTRQ